MGFLAAGEQFVLLEESGVLLEAVRMNFFDTGNGGENVRSPLEPFFPGDGGEGRINVVGFFGFIVAGGGKQVEDVLAQVDGITAVDVNGLAGAGRQEIVENFGMLLFLIGGEAEYVRNDPQMILLGLLGGDCVAVAGLAFTGKGAHQVQAGTAVVKVNGHKEPPFSLYRSQCVRERLNVYPKTVTKFAKFYNDCRFALVKAWLLRYNNVVNI